MTDSSFSSEQAAQALQLALFTAVRDLAAAGVSTTLLTSPFPGERVSYHLHAGAQAFTVMAQGQGRYDLHERQEQRVLWASREDLSLQEVLSSLTAWVEAEASAPRASLGDAVTAPEVEEAEADEELEAELEADQEEAAEAQEEAEEDALPEPTDAPSQE